LNPWANHQAIDSTSSGRAGPSLILYGKLKPILCRLFCVTESWKTGSPVFWVNSV
jgi:hypothetical protein